MASGKKKAVAAAAPKVQEVVDTAPNNRVIFDYQRVAVEALKLLDYRVLRKTSYPALGDQISAILESIASGNSVSVQDILKAVAGVKAKYPKDLELAQAASSANFAVYAGPSSSVEEVHSRVVAALGKPAYVKAYKDAVQSVLKSVVGLNDKAVLQKEVARL